MMISSEDSASEEYMNEQSLSDKMSLCSIMTETKEKEK